MTHIREEFLKLNPASTMTYNSELSEWIIGVKNDNVHLPFADEFTYTLTPDGKLPETQEFPKLKQLVVNGNRVAFLMKIEI